MEAPLSSVLLTAEDVAARWSCATRTVYQMAGGPLPCIRFGRRMVRFQLFDVEEYERARHEGGRP